jgi:RNA polymerase sigma-70 factor (ECF subfamily)
MGVAEHLLEDAAQEVFSVVLRRREDFDPTRPVRPWLCGIAARVAADHRRKIATRREVVLDELPATGGDAHVREVDARQLLLRALDALSEQERAAVLLVDIEGHRALDIAASLGVPPGTIYARLHDGRKKLAAAVTRLLETRVPENR